MFKGSTVDLYTRDFLSSHLWLTSLQFRERNPLVMKVSNSSPWIRTLESTSTTAPFAKGAEEADSHETIYKRQATKEKWPQAKNRLEEETEEMQTAKRGSIPSATREMKSEMKTVDAVSCLLGWQIRSVMISILGK